MHRWISRSLLAALDAAEQWHTLRDVGLNHEARWWARWITRCWRDLHDARETLAHFRHIHRFLDENLQARRQGTTS